MRGGRILKNSQKVHIRSVDQKMLSGIDWETFLIKLVCCYFQADESRNLSEIPLINNHGESTSRNTKETIQVLLKSNHEDRQGRVMT